MLDDVAVVELSNGISNIIFYGNKGSGLHGSIIRSDPFLEVRIEGSEPLDIETNLVGAYNFPNILAAVCVGSYLRLMMQK